jgi:hypothetical protein
MIRRLLLGVVLGLVVGGLVAFGLVGGLHLALFGADTGGAIFAYVAAALTGVLTGLVAGKPIWASGAKIEAGLKAFFGALLGAGLMFALRQWVHVTPDVAALAPGVSPAALHEAALYAYPALSLPILAAVLGGFFELDNTGGGEKADDKGSAGGAKKRVADGKVNGTAGPRVEEDDEGEAEEAAPAAKRTKR